MRYDRFEDAKNKLKELFDQNPSLSLRKAASAVDVSYNLTRDILKNQLNLKPYKYNEFHQLEPQDYSRRAYFALFDSYYLLNLNARSPDFNPCDFFFVGLS